MMGKTEEIWRIAVGSRSNGRDMIKREMDID